MTTLSAIGASLRNATRPVPLPPGRRGSEFAMICFAIGIMAFALASVGFALNGHLPHVMVMYVGVFAVLMIGAHLTVRYFAPWADPLVVPLAAVLNGLGLVMMYRLQESGRNGNPGLAIVTMTGHDATHQLLWTVLGIAAFVAVLVLFREPRTLQRYTYTLGTLGLILVALPALLPSSISAVPYTDAKIQIAIGGFSFQPAEFARILLAVFFAGYLVTRREMLSARGRRFLGIDLPPARVLGPILVL